MVRMHSQEDRLLRPELGWLGRWGGWTAGELASGADVGRWLGCAGLAALGAGICGRAVASRANYFPRQWNDGNMQEDEVSRDDLGAVVQEEGLHCKVMDMRRLCMAPTFGGREAAAGV